MGFKCQTTLAQKTRITRWPIIKFTRAILRDGAPSISTSRPAQGGHLGPRRDNNHHQFIADACQSEQGRGPSWRAMSWPVLDYEDEVLYPSDEHQGPHRATLGGHIYKFSTLNTVVFKY